MLIRRFFCIALAAIFLLSGCSSSNRESASSPTLGPTVAESAVPLPSETQPSSIPTTTMPDVSAEAQALSAEPLPAVPVIPEAEASGTACIESKEAVIDYSHTEDGYVMICYTASTDKRLKVLVKGPTTTYNYNLHPDSWTVFPLSDGNGSYQIGVYKNIADSRYATVLTADFSVRLQDEFAPFLRPNQYVNYTSESMTVQQGLKITSGLDDPLHKVAAVYDYVVSELHYDTEKAQTVQSGYLPVLDEILEKGTGICFDYAAVMTAMLRSQEIPCKLVVGYAESVYHAWISVWTAESGWIDSAIFFDGHVWHRMDPTFASSSERSQEILDFIQNGSYTVKYLY